MSQDCLLNELIYNLHIIFYIYLTEFSQKTRFLAHNLISVCEYFPQSALLFYEQLKIMQYNYQY